ncbi:hypothetical protein BCR35DRAFT_326295 [Leucosporidium creatinivorum]|uniref:Uncharacterized protein n=1 Tax=Leucosporidium creatinivorum TaxID=106004 RepID=A0A1Y2EL01_9BASI|nr:hypothetical protein BCR35DRAFT_326295 [Leucosporidium creatinivorum]
MLRTALRPTILGQPTTAARFLLSPSTSLSRSLSHSARRLERQPTFTTPIEPVKTYTAQDAAKPLPPTDLPVEDYASPLLHTASFFHQLFRYAVFTSVGIVLVGVGSVAAVHAWVEKVELAGGSIEGDAESDPEGWGEELEGWSGAWRGGGTDPRLGFFARAAIRGAWISQHWGGGIVASPVSQTQQALRTSNPTGNPFASSLGGTMIGGKSVEQPSLGTEVGDAGWRLAESYLVYALVRAEKKGVSLVFPEGHERGTPQSHPTSVTYTTTPGGGSGVDRAAVELEERLAGLRERIGGRYKLEEAREGWERIYYALSASAEPTGWETREKLRATRKLGELSARLALLWRAGTEERELEQSKAEGWLLGGLLPVLAKADRRTLDRSTLAEDSSSTFKKVASPISSFFAFWSRSHPSSTASSPTLSTIPTPSSPSTPLRPELSTLVNLLTTHDSTTSPLHPATYRSIIASLISLEAQLARQHSLPAAHALQSSSLHFTQLLLPHSPTTPTPLPTPTLSSSSTAIATASHALTHLHLATRTSVLSTHLAEVSLALRLPSTEAFSLSLLQGSINTTESVLHALESSPLLKVKSTGWSSSREKILGRAARQVQRDARVTGAMSANLVGLVHEMGPRATPSGWGRGKGKGKKEESEWYGGPAVAEAFYAKAMEFAKGDEGKSGEGEDVQGMRIAREGFERVRGKVLGEKKGTV